VNGLIAKSNGKKYAANKTFGDKENPHDALITNTEKSSKSKMIINRHFRIFGHDNGIDELPEFIFRKIQIKKLFY